MKKMFAFMFLFILSLNLSCKKAPTEPAENIEPGRRDYEWTADTIKGYFLTLYTIWGDSEKNVWVVSAGGSDHVFHYDGISWSSRNAGPIVDPYGVFGFDNDVWIAGYNQTGRIGRYDNGVFHLEYELKYEGYETGLIDICGKSKTDLYAVGTKMIDNYTEHDGVICHYDGKQWSVKTIIKDAGNLTKIRYSGKTNKYYILSNFPMDSNSSGQRIYEYDGNATNLIYDKIVSDETLCSINNIQYDIYIVSGKKVFKYTNSKYELIFEIDHTNFGGQVYGRSSKDIIVRMLDGFTHYNGENIKYILKLSDSYYPGFCAVFEKEIFCVAKSNIGFDIIYHGKLKKEE